MSIGGLPGAAGKNEYESLLEDVAVRLTRLLDRIESMHGRGKANWKKEDVEWTIDRLNACQRFLVAHEDRLDTCSKLIGKKLIPELSALKALNGHQSLVLQLAKLLHSFEQLARELGVELEGEVR